MEKRVIRKHIVQGSSTRIVCTYDEEASLLELSLKHGKDDILEKVFDEKMTNYQELLEAYNQLVNGENSEEFEIMYLIKENFGIVINEHIYLCYSNEKFRVQQEQVFPWCYIESKKYLGDTWWFEDSEILNDIQNLSIIDFVEKYKGY